MEFEDCWDNRTTVEVSGQRLPLISIDDLRRNKLALGRHQDLADLENLDDIPE